MTDPMISETCGVCGFPKDLCVCQHLEKISQKIRITCERRKFKKYYTIVSGLNLNSAELKKISKELKSSLACGGTLKGNIIELQGDHRAKMIRLLQKLGFHPESIEIV